MAEVWRQKDFETLEYWVICILTEASDKLNDWETRFVSQMDVRISNRWALTESQQNKLESIYADKTG